jgi:hypothetical protein
MGNQPAAMWIFLYNNSPEDLHFVTGSPGLDQNFSPVIKANDHSGGGAEPPRDSEVGYTVNWTYSPDPGLIGTTSLNFECIFDATGGVTINSSKTGRRANEWTLTTTQERGEPVYYVNFLYQAKTAAQTIADSINSIVGQNRL